ncbi:MAG TPA: hypothetical protein VIV40_18045 [Kofleriaceae bacterium]
MAAVRVIALLALSGCVGGVSGGGGGSDSGTADPDAKVDAPKLMWIDASNGGGTTLPCKNAATPPGDGHHFPGKNCFDGCHNHGFTLAGTLYTNSTGNTAFPGATITIIDANNKSIDIVTNLNGNFYTTQAIAFPVLTFASSCPSSTKMNVAVAATGRGCNTCHVGGTNDQLHLP